METIDFSQLFEIFVRWQFLASGVAIYILVNAIKRSLLIAFPKLVKKPKFRGLILSNLNIMLGVLIGFIPDFLLPAGSSLSSSVIIGVLAGWFSTYIYSVLKKRTIEENIQEITEKVSSGEKENE